ncbi:uncharacterized protein LOC111274723 isoform X2 [Durio zibethinus]|uniref:Uncharacterized protein LOC111274723 isoform X2 n=1 Tax=Durio zibethinus TaxID=66656 RepID=A0A6P5WIS7_DURZI|nr:uncharacterized protein LOC111274723 isoform X2 [Durio zibethinus]XP_022715327.1 uncharacterized protein LOC111274723 isoform X2 [Durio zibethinus]
MAIYDSESSKDYNEGFEEEIEDCSSFYGSDPYYDSGTDPSYSIEEDTRAKFQKSSIKKKSRPGVARDSDFSIEKDPEEREMDLPEVDDKSYENVQEIIKAGKLEKLKVDECKVYLRKNGLRLSGKKDLLIQRIKEHLEILNGGGEKKYPLSSFVLNCKGDACTGDVVMFEQNVYETFNIASRSACGPPCGTRIIAGRIVKESYGAAKQQHTFTIEVLWSRGKKPLPPLYPLLIKGRNLYRLKTLRQRWEDEGERQKVLMDKHSRGSLARSNREVRIQEKERRRMLRADRILKQEQSKNQSHLSSITTIQPGSSTNSGMLAPQHQHSGLTVLAGKITSQTCGGSLFDLEKLSIMSQRSGVLAESQQLAIQPQQSGLSVAPREKMIQLSEQSGFCPNFWTKSFQSECQNVHIWNRYQNQIPCDSLKSSGIQEVQLRRGDKLYESCKQPNHMNIYWNCTSDKSMASGTNKMPEPNYHRQQLKSMNHCHHPATLPQRQGFLSQKLCRYHAQGRCYYGENCKFLHEPREVHGAGERRCWRIHCQDLSLIACESKTKQESYGPVPMILYERGEVINQDKKQRLAAEWGMILWMPTSNSIDLAEVDRSEYGKNKSNLFELQQKHCLLY